MMEAQRRAMQQAQELQAYMKDLLKWEKDVEVKPRVRTTPAAELPPVRGSVPGGAGARNGSTGGASTRHTPPTCSTEGLREEGNEHFRKGRLNEAAASYTTSLKLKPTPAAFANRAAVYLKRREWDRAEADCSACLELDAGFVKAYHRRWFHGQGPPASAPLGVVALCGSCPGRHAGTLPSTERYSLGLQHKDPS